jgi:hypothetical protein
MSNMTIRDLRATLTLNPSTGINHISQNTSNGRLFVNAGQKCCDCTAISKVVAQFFAHRRADLQMFCHSFSSWRENASGIIGSRTVIRSRIDEVTRFMNVVENAIPNQGPELYNDRNNDRNAVYLAYQRLPPHTRLLFSRIDQNYVSEFRRGLLNTREMRREMIRECQRVITYQRRLIPVVIFVSVMHQRSSPATTSEIREGRVEPHRQGGESVDGSSTLGATPQVDLRISGTLPYIQDLIPVEVHQKADAISQLKTRFANLRPPPNVPAYFNCSVSMDFMEIPVFDASHPAVQDALRAVNTPGAAAGAFATLNNRVLRHSLDKDSLEQHFTANPRTAKCPTCRHAQRNEIGNEMINRRDLLIDTALQDEILGFLRRHVPPTTG